MRTYGTSSPSSLRWRIRHQRSHRHPQCGCQSLNGNKSHVSLAILHADDIRPMKTGIKRKRLLRDPQSLADCSKLVAESCLQFFRSWTAHSELESTVDFGSVCRLRVTVTRSRHLIVHAVGDRMTIQVNSWLQFSNSPDILDDINGHGRSVLKHQSPAIVPRDLDDSGVKMLPGWKVSREDASCKYYVQLRYGIRNINHFCVN
jgi:hypothetical protein